MFTFIKLHGPQKHPYEDRPLEFFLQPNPGLFSGMAEATGTVEENGVKREVVVTRIFLGDHQNIVVQETPEQIRRLCEEAMNQELQMLNDAQRQAQGGLLVPTGMPLPAGQVSGRRPSGR